MGNVLTTNSISELTGAIYIWKVSIEKVILQVKVDRCEAE